MSKCLWSVCEAGASGSEELKKCPPPSPAVMWFVNIRERKARYKKKNLLKCVNFILNVISTGMNDDHIRFIASIQSDLVYNIICDGTGMGSDFDWIASRDLTPIHKLKGTVMQIEEALINDPLRVLKVSWKFRNSNVYNFAAIYSWNLLFSLKIAYFLTVYIVFPVYQQNFMAQ